MNLKWTVQNIFLLFSHTFSCFPILSVPFVVNILTNTRKSVVLKDKTNKIFSHAIKFRNKLDLVFFFPLPVLLDDLTLTLFPGLFSLVFEPQYLIK